MKQNINPKLSIIIATYNAASTLRKALKSVISLRYEDWECIIIDGKSTDSTLEIITEFEQTNTRLKHISEPDSGLYDAFNKGLKIAKGEWIYYLGSDDSLTIDGISKIMSQAYIVDDNTAIVSGGVIRIRQDRSERVIMSKGFIGSHQAMVMRRAVMESMNGFNFVNYKILADFDLFTRIKNSGYSVRNCNAIVAYFHAGGTSEHLNSTMQVVKEKYAILKNDRYCKYPLLITIGDTMKTILGSIYHRFKARLDFI